MTQRNQPIIHIIQISKDTITFWIDDKNIYINYTFSYNNLMKYSYEEWIKLFDDWWNISEDMSNLTNLIPDTKSELLSISIVPKTKSHLDKIITIQ